MIQLSPALAILLEDILSGAAFQAKRKISVGAGQDRTGPKSKPNSARSFKPRHDLHRAHSVVVNPCKGAVTGQFSLSVALPSFQPLIIADEQMSIFGRVSLMVKSVNKVMLAGNADPEVKVNLQPGHQRAVLRPGIVEAYQKRGSSSGQSASALGHRSPLPH